MQRKPALRLAGLALASALVASGAQAATINKDLTNPFSIPGLTGFATTGAMMSGLSVTANFVGGGSETLLWATTGATSGGVTGTGWSLSLDGDTFAANWNFVFAPGTAGLQLASLVLDGRNSFTVLDTTDPNPGTDASAQGADFAITAGDVGLDAAAIANYSSVVAISPNAPIGDLFQVVRVTLGPNGTRNNFSFRQDTDNDSRLTVPEPTSLALAGLALAGLGAASRRRQR